MEFEKIRKIIAEVLSFDVEEITMDTTFVDDLGADSLDVYQIITEIEDEFGIGEISADELENIVTVSDAVEAVKKRVDD
ncbi:acyl carrier protein [Acetitomaculum ruminis DSM 5522]|uniref:Acyl carrier protein n=1 Tax=Acetitomaculum ruminis DSM 5522 TaxID=1120918 RepID=A0A1I0VR11_9FIRM|nr:acyl carrier protein [Acetitomaculum ruminis]SFA78320.1 acyl carrier protein [Acetitomaculum ruminis DSM 5522]